MLYTLIYTIIFSTNLSSIKKKEKNDRISKDSVKMLGEKKVWKSPFEKAIFSLVEYL